MKNTMLILLTFLVMFSLLSCNSNTSIASNQNISNASTVMVSKKENNSKAKEKTKQAITVKIGKKTYNGILYKNDTTKALLDKMPLTLKMSELNNNEKYYYLPYSLPTNAKKVGKIKTGDLLLFGTDCLVLFYDNIKTSYSYTRLGYLENAGDLAEELGNGNVKITFKVGD